MMTWLKTEVDDELDKQIREYQEKTAAANKVEAVKELLKIGLKQANKMAQDNEKCHE